MIETILLLGILLTSAKLAGEVAERAKLPAIFGEIGVGILAGPVFGVVALKENEPPETLKLLSEIGAVFLLFSIGFTKVEIERLAFSLKKAIPVVFLGALFPFVAGLSVGLCFSDVFLKNPFQAALLLGTTLAATSIGVSLRSLMDLKYIATVVGSTVLLTAVLDNILSLCVLGIVIKVIKTGEVSLGEFFLMLLSIAGFLCLLFLFARFLLVHIANILSKMVVEEALFCLIVGGLFIFVYITERFGLSHIIGAFLFGASLSAIPRLKTERIVHKVEGIGAGFFIPFFFINIGLLFDFSSLSGAGAFGATLVIALICFQIAGGFVAGKISRFSAKDSFIIGVTLIPRNELALVITSIGFELALFSIEVLSSLILLSIITTLITPFMLRLIIKENR